MFSSGLSLKINFQKTLVMASLLGLIIFPLPTANLSLAQTPATSHWTHILPQENDFASTLTPLSSTTSTTTNTPNNKNVTTVINDNTSIASTTAPEKVKQISTLPTAVQNLSSPQAIAQTYDQPIETLPDEDILYLQNQLANGDSIASADKDTNKKHSNPYLGNIQKF